MGTNRQRITSTHSAESQKSKYRSLIQLRQDITVLEGISIIMGVIIGSGIFVSPVGVLMHTDGNTGLSLIIWLVTGLFSLTGALVWAELGSTIPRSGGEFIYLLTTFGEIPAFISLWIAFVLVGAVSVAANSIIFAQYILQPFFIGCSPPRWAVIILALFGLLTLSGVNCYNVSWTTKLATVFTIAKVLALFIIIGIGVAHLVMGTTNSFEDPFNDITVKPGSLAMAFYKGFWAYSGWNCLNFLTHEMKNPEKNLPLAIIISLVVITIIYIFANVAYLAVLTPHEMLMIGKSSTAIAVNFADRTMGVMSWTMPIFVGVSVLGSMNAEILSLSRLTHTGAEEQQLPQILAMVSYRYLTPIPAIIVITILAIFFQIYQDAFYLIDLSGFAFCFVSAMCVFCLLYIRIKHPNINRSLKLPIFIPILFLMVDVFIAVLTIYQNPRDSIYSILMILISIPMYFVFIGWKYKPKTFNDMLISITLNLQKFLLVVPQEVTYEDLSTVFKSKESKQNGNLKSVDSINSKSDCCDSKCC